MKITVGIPSVGRAAILHQTILGLGRQSLQPDAILIAVASPSDYLPETARLPLVQILMSDRGCARQRNTILRELSSEAGLIAFFDDDVELDPDYFRNAVKFMDSRPDVAAFTGLALADGFDAGEIPRDEALRILETSPPLREEWVRPRTGLYGCNMVIRAAVAKAVGFDDRLALYSISEDLDFGERCRAFGDIVSVSACRMVHLATRSGRGSPERFGYAQITTPLYLWRKGSVPRSYLSKMVRNVVLANLAGLIIVHRNKPRSARLLQLKGNLLAFSHFVTGGARPERITEIRG